MRIYLQYQGFRNGLILEANKKQLTFRALRHVVLDNKP